MKLTKNYLQLGGIQPLLVLLDCPSALLLKRRAFFGEQFDPILLF